ncbi:MAG TPA: ABC transporter permease [Actinomycetota bacterium]|nr:ABC transporter permease [Actinomycetota bacterium]
MGDPATAAGATGRPAWVDTFRIQLLALAGALLFAAVVGGIIIASFGENPLTVYRVLWTFSTSRLSDFGKVLEIATPLIYSALAVAVAFKAGMFNIGVEGQYFVAMVTASAVALALEVPAVIHLPLVVLAAVIGGVVWAAIPAILKVKTGAHEVVTTIMMNGIAVSLVAWALLHPLRTGRGGLVDLRSDQFPDTALVPSLGSTFGLEEQLPGSVHLTWLFPLALVAALLVWFLLYRTRLGFETRAVGSAPGAAEAGGVSIGATQIKVFVLSGALAGFVGLNHLLGDAGFLGANYETQLGFTGIAVAFLGRNSPFGIVVAAIALGLLNRGEDGLALVTDLPREIVIILEGLLILSVVIAYEITRRIVLRRRQREVRSEEGAIGGASGAPA